MSLRSLQSRLRQSSNIRLLRRYAPKGQAPRNDGGGTIHNTLSMSDYTDIRTEVEVKFYCIYDFRLNNQS